jgi:hypothetical protein
MLLLQNRYKSEQKKPKLNKSNCWLHILLFAVQEKDKEPVIFYRTLATLSKHAKPKMSVKNNFTLLVKDVFSSID